MWNTTAESCWVSVDKFIIDSILESSKNDNWTDIVDLLLVNSLVREHWLLSDHGCFLSKIVESIGTLNEWELSGEGKLAAASSAVFQSSAARVSSKGLGSRVEVHLLSTESFSLLNTFLRWNHSFSGLISIVKDSLGCPPIIVRGVDDMEDVSIVE